MRLAGGAQPQVRNVVVFLRGGVIHGKYPRSLGTDHELNAGRGRVIPTTSWKSVWNALGEWLGLERRGAEPAPGLLPNSTWKNFEGYPYARPGRDADSRAFSSTFRNLSHTFRTPFAHLSHTFRTPCIHDTFHTHRSSLTS